jgi:carbamoyl-phosphate synthase large subunit
MATVLVTGAGGPCGIGAIKSLSTRTPHRIVGVDMDGSAAGLQLADEGATVPAATNEAWPQAMADLVDGFAVDAILPTVDEELAVLPSLRDVLPEDVAIVAPTQPVISLASDKYRTMTRLADAGHQTPRTWLGTETDAIDADAFPLIVKPRQGRGSRGVQRVEDRDALSAHLSATEHDPAALLCQEYIAGTEYTTSVVVTADNRLLAVVPKEAIQKEGSTVLGATREQPAVTETCTELFETLSPAGPINVQQIVDDEGTPHLIEINPRFSSTSCLTAAAGVDEFDLLIRDGVGEAVDPPEPFEADRYILRYQSHLFADSADLGAVGDGIDSEPLVEQ